MKIKLLFVGVILLLAALWPRLALGQAPARPTTRYQTQFEIVKAPAQFDELLVYAEAAPGSATPPHIHGGNQYVTVLEGDLTRQVFSPVPSVKQHPAGDTWSEITGEVHQVFNRGTVTARTIGTFLLPRGAPLTTIQKTGATSQQLPGPKTLAQAKLSVDQPPAQFDLMHLVLDLAPNASSPEESYGGQALSLVLEGSVTVRSNGTDKTYRAGESWSNEAGQVFTISNLTGEKASLAVSVLLPPGASLITGKTPVGDAPSTMPTSGASSQAISNGWIVLLAGVILLSSGVLLWRKRGRA